MRNCCFTLTMALCAALILTGCTAAGSGGAFLPAASSRSAYAPQLPEIPPAWEALLGEPVWRLEWLNPAGGREAVTITGGGKREISPPETWTSPVIAWPYWPNRGIDPGVFRPAGALFPFDASGGTIRLSWLGGVDAVLYWELAHAAGSAAEEESLSRAVSRLPQHFNWPRFRELFGEGSGINEDVRLDPWLADWPAIAAKIVRSSFDKRRLVPAAREKLSVPTGPGPWLGTSPFAAPLLFQGQPVFPVQEAADSWVSAEGLLRCSKKAWIFRAWN